MVEPTRTSKSTTLRLAPASTSQTSPSTTSTPITNFCPTVNKMEAFENELDSQHGSGRVSDPDYASWSDQAAYITMLLEELCVGAV